MKKPLLLLSLLSLSLLAGCSVPPGGASQFSVGFGVPSVFRFDKDITGIKVTDKTIKADSSSTKITIFLFTWDSMAKDLYLTNPPKD